MTKDETNIAKGVAMLLMLVHHLFGFPGRLPSECPLTPFIIGGVNLDIVLGQFARICIGMFFVLSGYALGIRPISIKALPKGIVQRVLSFYSLFWVNFFVLVSLSLLVAYYIPSTPHRVSLELPSFISNFLLLSTSYSLEWWFGRAYVLTIIIVWPILVLLRWKSPWLCLLVSVPVLLFSLYAARQGIVFWQACFSIGFFLSSFELRGFFQKASARLSKWQVLTLGLSSLGLIIYLRNPLEIRLDCIFAPLVIIIAVCLIRRCLPNAPFIRLGELSGHMWLNHTFFFYYLFPRFFYGSQNHLIVFVLSLAASFVLALLTQALLSWILARLQEVPLPWSSGQRQR